MLPYSSSSACKSQGSEGIEEICKLDEVTLLLRDQANIDAGKGGLFKVQNTSFKSCSSNDIQKNMQAVQHSDLGFNLISQLYFISITLCRIQV